MEKENSCHNSFQASPSGNKSWEMLLLWTSSGGLVLLNSGGFASASSNEQILLPVSQLGGASSFDFQMGRDQDYQTPIEEVLEEQWYIL